LRGCNMSGQKDNKTKPAEQESNQTRRSKIILETSIDGLCVVGLDGKILEVNSSLCDILGYSKEELLKMKITDIEAFETAEQTAQHIDNVMKQGYDRFETKHRRKDGKTIDIEVSTQFCDFGEDRFFFSFFRDITEKRKVEEKLKETRVRLEYILSTTPVTTYTCKVGDNWAATFISENVRNQFGYEPRQFLEDPNFWLAHIHPEDSPRILAGLFRLFENDYRIHEYRFLHKDGSYRWVHDEVRLIRDEQGKPLECIGCWTDITEFKKAEDALRHSEEKYRSVVENIGIGVSLISPKMEILTLNRQLREWFPDIDVSKKPICYKAFNKPAREDVCSYCPTCKSLQDGQVHESVAETPVGGKIINYRIISSPVKDKDGKVIAAIEMVEDITERKKTEEALRESEERYKALFQGAAEGILVADTETMGFIYANPAICGMLGYTEEELKQMGVRDIHPKEDLEYVISEFEAQARGETILLQGIPCLRKDGVIMYVDINTAMVLIGGRQYNVGFFTDITERKRIRAELENYKEKVLRAQRHTYVGSMGAVVAHQVNQPLTKINILLDRAIEQIEEASCSPGALKNVKEGLAEAQKAASIIRKFRQYSKNSALEGTANVNVRAVAGKIASVLSRKAKQVKMRIAIKGLRDLPEVETNETALEQIFLIIIQNAIEAADGRKPHKLNITGKLADGNIELRFSDDCCGIAPENLDRIFEPFFSTKTEDRGMGLGLDIVQQILISCSGQIRVESQLGKGTTFYVTLPISNTLGA